MKYSIFVSIQIVSHIKPVTGFEPRSPSQNLKAKKNF